MLFHIKKESGISHLSGECVYKILQVLHILMMIWIRDLKPAREPSDKADEMCLSAAVYMPVLIIIMYSQPYTQQN